MDMDLEQKAIMRLREAADTSERFYKAPLIVTTSGGKDSSVCVALAEKAGIDFEVMHNHTTVDAPETVAERTSALVAERQTLTYIAPARPEAAEETPEELTVEPEPENRYAELHFSDEDVYILACLVYHEARGESFEGQVAVVEVVLNRMLSDYFPDTVEEVVFQKYGDVWQFSPAPYLYSAEPDKEQYLAVHTAIEEREHILSEDTVYFSTAPYNDSLDMVIGNHYFCKIF